jgi:hypothetical protein
MHNWDDAFIWSSAPVPEELDITGIAGAIEGRLIEGED